MYGVVYLILETNQYGDETHKIGVTKRNITKRISELQTGNPNQLILLSSYETKHYKQLEKWLHRKFSCYKTNANNEWFYLPNETVLNFILECKKIEKSIILLMEHNPFYK